MITKNYQPQPAWHLLNVFVETWFAPDGRGGDNETWRCGFMAHILSFLLSAQNIPHTISSGHAYVFNKDGKQVGEGVAHVWVKLERDTFHSEDERFINLDPAIKQFGLKEGFSVRYEELEEIKTPPFTPLTFGPVNGPDIKLFSIGKEEGVTFDMYVSDDHPPLRFTMGYDVALQFRNTLVRYVPFAAVPTAAPKQEEPTRTEKEKAVFDARSEVLRWAKLAKDMTLPIEWREDAANKRDKATAEYSIAVEAYFGFDKKDAA